MTMNSKVSISPARAVAAILILRLVTLPFLPFVDPSEARFAASAAHMASSANWVTPMIHLGQEGWVPYWAKPPLHVWFAALFFRLFGVHEWAARLPAFLDFSLIVGMLITLTRKIGRVEAGEKASAILLTTIGIFIFGFSCITDSTLSACVSCALMSFALCAEESKDTKKARTWSHLFFLFLGAGVLTKGPVAVVLVGGSLFFWLLIRNAWRELARLSWVSGFIIFLGVTVPWYLAAEHVTPGFLKYYFVQENFLRYVSSHADIRYGSLHKQPYGMIWPMLLGVTAPWCFVLFLFPFKPAAAWQRIKGDRWLSFALCWGVFPALFFTLARQVLTTYVFPGMPGLALAAALALEGKPREPAFKKISLWLALIYSALLLIAWPFAGTMLSTKKLAQSISERDFSPRVVGVIVRDPHSLRLYGESYGERSFSVDAGLTPKEALERALPIILSREQDRELLSDPALNFGAHCNVASKIGEWDEFICPTNTEK